MLLNVYSSLSNSQLIWNDTNNDLYTHIIKRHWKERKRVNYKRSWLIKKDVWLKVFVLSTRQDKQWSAWHGHTLHDSTGWKIDSNCWVRKVLSKESEWNCCPAQRNATFILVCFWQTMTSEKESSISTKPFCGHKVWVRRRNLSSFWKDNPHSNLHRLWGSKF